MKRLLIVFLLILAFKHTSAQKINVDSLIKVAISFNKKYEAGTPPHNPDSLLRTLYHSKSAERIRKVYDIILLDNGELDPAKALYYHHKILDTATKHHDDIVKAVITGELGFTLYQNGDAPAGQKMIFDALTLAEKTGNKQAIGTVYDNLGVCAEDNDESLTYYKKAFKYSIAGGDNLFAVAELNNISAVYLIKHDTDSAKYYLLKSLKLALSTHVPYLMINCVERFGQLQTDNKLKLKYYRYALTMAASQRNTLEKGGVLLEMAQVYRDEHQADSALAYAKESYRLRKGELLSRILLPAKLLAQLYTGKNADSALKYTITYYTAKDSLQNIGKMERAQAIAFADQQQRQESAAQKVAFQTTLRMYLLVAIILFFLVLAIVFWRNNRQKQKANHILSEQKEEIETQRDNLGQALKELKNTQTQLIQSEKMASLGELTAGIAHEIQNPLNFVNNFSDVNQEMLIELREELDKGDVEDAKAIAADIEQNEVKINHHGKRADAIVKGMLQHSRTSSGQKEPTDLNALADEYLRLSYHGLRSKDKNFNAELSTHFDEKLLKVNIIPQDIGRVLLNLFNNAFYAVNQKQKIAGEGYKAEVSVSTSFINGQVILAVKDNGIGIPDTIKEKIMQPFFTTKPTGEGTGLGLSLTYDIVVKGHGGKIEVNTNEGEFTEFQIILPLSQ